ncbi:RHS repeat domain-containing protein [Pseudomonas sp. NyZ201]|uniref:RHS repeat domain-containing protein n=1 Tax=Pseudomonas sp. NyZ201 TaxID=3409857 RepID=UPI003CE8FE5A
MSLAVHALTPVLAVRDARGLGLREVNYCRRAPADPLQPRIQGSQYDAAGRLRASSDPRLWALQEQDAATPANLGQVHSLSGRVVWRESVDSGSVCSLFGEAGQVVRAEDGKGICREFDYDAMLRPTALHEQASGQPRACRERLGYADAAPEHAAQNACGRLLRHDDTAGTRELRGYALNGEVRSEVRRFSRDVQSPDWPLPIAERELLLEPDTAAVLYCHGPLGEVLEQTDASDNRQSLGLTLCGELREVRVQLKDGRQHVLLAAARYNAFGQLEEEILGNGVRLQRLYREEDGRLSQLAARRRNGDLLQELHYEYDPAGNVLSIEDRAMPVRHFANQQVEPRCEYGYDSLYQLIEAKGWEAGAASKGPGSLLDPGAVSNYRQSYEYDAGGNLLHLVHAGAQAHGRTLVAARHSNRCLPANEDFEKGFDANGNLLSLQPGQALLWNTRNELREVRPVIRAGGSDDWERYLYDGAGRRVRKLGSAQAAKRTHSREVRYLPGLERHDNGSERLEVITVQAGTCGVRILHWLQGRPAGVAQDQVRHALGDHLGSVCLELDGEAALLGREVFHPFGSTAWWAGRNEVEAGYKTVRYSGKERDASGLYYYGARYYRADWQRWLNPDPAGEMDGLNLFRMVGNAPINRRDFDGLLGHDSIDHAETILSTDGNRLVADGFDKFEPEWQNKVREAVQWVQQWTTAARKALQGELDQQYLEAAIAASFGPDLLKLPESLDTVKKDLGARLQSAEDFLQGAISDSGGRLLVAEYANEQLQALTLKFGQWGARIALSASVIQGSKLNLAATLLHEALHAAGTQTGRGWDQDDVLDHWYVLPTLVDAEVGPGLEAMLHSRAISTVQEGPDEQKMSPFNRPLYIGLMDRLTKQYRRPPAASADERARYFRNYPRMRQAVILRNADSITAFAMTFDRFRTG